MVLVSSNPPIKFVIWHAEYVAPERTDRYLCLDLPQLVDDATETYLRRSLLMYGFFQGRACWHAVWSAEFEAELREVLDKATFIK